MVSRSIDTFLRGSGVADRERRSRSSSEGYLGWRNSWQIGIDQAQQDLIAQFGTLRLVRAIRAAI
jgi:hypothetical protein